MGMGEEAEGVRLLLTPLARQQTIGLNSRRPCVFGMADTSNGKEYRS